ncbi:GNAT family N-acetyltransferase [Aquibacillus kalidii]|uniref:GNAT family N-acetyltransferase n=1 Tax=Aquibacillus kalidii TaxID=2762597 RepID=UPI00164497D0|nr:GNAT family N-acetyltransferase [Aquibacillus kalidii]
MRIISTKDYHKIALLNKEVHDLHAQLYPNFFKKYKYNEIVGFFQRAVHNPNSIFLLLEDSNQALGYVWAEIFDYPDSEFGHSYRSLYIHQISIVKKAQSKGYGSKLMENIYMFARNNGIFKIELDYWADNEIAKSFYKKQGFKKVREFVYKDLTN